MNKEQHQPSSETPPKRVIVEIGSGILPMPDLGTRSVGPDELYVGIDNNLEDLTIGANMVDSDRAVFMQANGEALPFQDGLISEIIINDVAGSPKTTPESMHAILNEAARVLLPGGAAVVIEEYSPLSLEIWNEILKEVPLKIEKYVKQEEAEFAELYATYKRPGNPIADHGYILIMKKSEAA